MRTAITVVAATARISPMYDAAKHVLVITNRRRNTVTETELLEFPPGREQRRLFFLYHEIRFLITGAIANEDAAELIRMRLQLCPFSSGNWREVWEQWRCNRRLSTQYLLPGCCKQYQKCRIQCKKGMLS